LEKRTKVKKGGTSLETKKKFEFNLFSKGWMRRR